MNTGKRSNQPDIDQLLTEEVYPALYERLDTAFPEFNWKREGKAWTATRWPKDFPFPVGHENPDRLMVYADRPWWIKVHGHTGVRFLDLVNRGQIPVGPDFIAAVRTLCDLAGVPFPEREYTEAEKEETRKKEERKTVLQGTIDICQEILHSETGASARKYLTEDRHFTKQDIEDLGLGYYSSVSDVESGLRKAGCDLQAARDAALLWDDLEGYITIPWMDAAGSPLTIYGRWHTKPPPGGRPKTMALPGEGMKRSPLYFDRARKAGHKDLVAVEGVFDAAMAQVRGDTRVVAYGAAQFSALQVETLARHRVRTVTICPDPDGGGDRGALSSVESLRKAGIVSYVTPRLPDEMDPDEYITAHGSYGWKEFIARAIPGAVHRAKVEAGNVTPTSSDHVRREIVEKVGRIAAELRGPEAPLDREDLVVRCSEWTGYSRDAVTEMFKEDRRRHEEETRRKAVEGHLGVAGEEIRKGEPVQSVVSRLKNELGRIESPASDVPPLLSVNRLDAETKSLPAALSSGWTVVDRMGVEFNPGELTVFGARTGHCKTAVLVNLIVNFLHRGAQRILFYSSEEPEVRIYHRLLALLTAEQSTELGSAWTANDIRDFIRNPDCRGESYEWPYDETLRKAKETLRSWEDRLQVIYRPPWNAQDLANHALSESERDGVTAVLVDYLQRIPPPPGGWERRGIEISQIARRLQALSVEIDAPVIAGAQINRNALPKNYHEELNRMANYQEAKETIQKARPQLDQLREGGGEQEAPQILGLLNYAADYRTEIEKESPPPDTTRLEIGILKHRYGSVGGWAKLAFEGRFGWIRNPREGGDLTL